VRTTQLVELVRIKSYDHALITLLPLYCALIEDIMLALRIINSCSEDVYQLKKESKSLKDAIHHPMEDTMEHSVHIRRSGKVDFSGQPCMKTQKNLSRDVEHVRNMGTSIQEMPCH
jgi:hypothetical protein